LLEDVGLPGAYAARKPSELSGGERQRVVIARALAFVPDIIVCDEPVAALDVSVQAQVLEVLRAVNARGVSLLFITHDLAVVRQMTDGIVVLRRGEVVERGRTDQVLDAPSHPYTQALVDAVPNGQPDWLSDVSEPVLD
jgi:peptide/nickel transport system ATP-binding protein